MKTLYKLLAIVMIFGLVFAALPSQAASAEAVEVNPALDLVGDRFVSLQNNDGGWDWPLDDGIKTNASPQNTISPIGMGLAQAYLHTGDTTQFTALQKVGNFLLTKTKFTGTDYDLALMLDQILGVNTYAAFVKTNYYDKLAAGTYVRDGVTYSTATYIPVLRAYRSGQSANLAAWDLGVQLVSAVKAGVTGAELQYWIDGVEAEVNELDDYLDSDPTKAMWYLTEGLAGAVWGLAYADVDFDPTSGYYTDANNLADLAIALANLQNGSGGFVWHPAFMLDNDQNESTQATAYAILALSEFDRAAYLSDIFDAADYLLGIQLATGGWDNYPAVSSYAASGENNEVSAEAAWAVATAYPYPEVWVCESGDCDHPGFAFNTIQGAINAVDIGGTVYVADGTYNYDTEGHPADKGLIKIGKSVTLKALEDGNEIMPVIDASGAGGLTNDGVFKIYGTQFSGGTVIIEGFDITGIPQTGIAITSAMNQLPENPNTIIIRNNKIHGMIGGIDFWGSTAFEPNDDPANAVTSHIIIDNNEIYDMGVAGIVEGLGVMIEDPAAWAVVGGDYAAKITNNVFSNIVSKDASKPGAAIVLPRADSATEALNVLIQDNTINSTVVGIGVGITGGSGVDHLEIIENKILNTGVGVLNMLPVTVDVSPNWWGSSAGPTVTQYLGSVSFTPWCGDAACSFMNPTTLDGDLQAAIDAAPDWAIIYVPGPATYSQAGGFNLNNDRLTLILGDGVVIQNASPCFTVTEDHVRILGESLAGAKCVPTDGWPGIYAENAINDFVVDGLEFDGTGQRTAAGVYLNGGGSDIQILNNYMHDLSADGIPSTAIEVQNEITGVYDIRGNLFDGTAGFADIYNIFDATYNSWGKFTVGAPDVSWGCYPDNIYPYCPGEAITYDPWTHVQLFLTSSGTPWADQVVNGEEITYTVTADLVNITGAEFTLKYDTAKLDLDAESLNVTDVFDPMPIEGVEGGETAPLVSINETTGEIKYAGWNLTPVEGQGLELFTVTFTALETGSSDVFINPATDVFGMSPDSGPSNNVYAFALDSTTVNAIALPTLASDDIQGYYLTGDLQEFTVDLANLNGANYTSGVFYYRIKNATLADIATFQYEESQTPEVDWFDMPMEQVGSDVIGYWGDPVNGHPLPAGYPVGFPEGTGTNRFRVEFDTAKNYEFEFSLVDLDTNPDFTLVTFTGTAVVYNKPEITETGLTGDHQGLTVPFTLNINNMSDMSPVTFLVDLDLPEDTVLTYPGGSVTCGATGCQFPVTLAAGANAIPLSAVFPSTVIDLDVPVALYDSLAEPERLLQSTTFKGVSVYNNVAAVLGTVSMQGRTARTGVPVTLTAAAGFPYGPYTATSIEQISNNITFLNVADGTYTVTTNQPRYLNLTAGQNKKVTISAATLLNTLELKGGNAVWSDNIINIQDAGLVGFDFNKTDDIDSDVNFDGKVNIQDLSLVGGNFDLTSNLAYGSWAPVTLP